MNKRNLLKITNVIIGILILNQATTALLSDILPQGVFEPLHEGGGATLFVAVLVHVYLNWAWVKANLLPGRRKSEK